MAWLLLLLVGCGLFESTEELRKGPAPVAEAPAVDAAAQARARSIADQAAAATSGEAGGSADDCATALAAAASRVATEQGANAGAYPSAAAAGEGTPLWAQAWGLEHPEGSAEALDEVVETPEGRFAHLIRPVPGCGFVWVEAQVAASP
jgi:hypothetical protein